MVAPEELEKRKNLLHPEKRTCNKFSFTTRAKAKAALRNFNKDKTIPKKLTDVYLCTCGRYHLTSKPKKENRRQNFFKGKK